MRAVTINVNTGKMVTFGSESASQTDKDRYRLSSEVSSLPSSPGMQKAIRKQNKITKALEETYDLETEQELLAEKEKQKKLSAEIDKKRSRFIDFSFGKKNAPVAQKAKEADADSDEEEKPKDEEESEETTDEEPAEDEESSDEEE